MKHRGRFCSTGDGSVCCVIYHIADGRYVGETQFSAANKVILYIRYVLDESGSVVGIGLWKSGDIAWTDFYFLKNLQGDIIEVYRESDNALMASYEYDAWGNIVNDHNYAYFAGKAIKDLNPFRYRGYYYDNETWFYYLQSRYYDPAIGRFINADAFASTGQGFTGHNMYAYCGNNPVMYVDPTGLFWEEIWEAIVRGIKDGLSNSVHVMSSDEDGWMDSSKTMGENLSSAVGANFSRVTGLTNDNFCDTWNNTLSKYAIVHTHGSNVSLSDNVDFRFTVDEGDSLNQNTNIQYVLITACGVAGDNGNALNMAQLLSTKISPTGYVIASTTTVNGDDTTFKSMYGGKWCVYQNGNLIQVFPTNPITMPIVAEYWKSQ